MEQEQMRQWLENQGIHPRLRKICLKIRGKTNVKQAEQSLAQAGFTVKKKPSLRVALHSEGRPLPCGAAAMQLRRLLYSAGEQYKNPPVKCR